MKAIALGSAALVLAAGLAAQSLVAAEPATPAPTHADAANSAADALFKEPFIDIDEWRTTPVRHRYVHGGFKGSDMRFSFYLPPKEQFQGRFFQYVTPVPDSENLSQTVLASDNNIGFAAASGAYFVETNGGGKGATAGPAFGADPTIGAYPRQCRGSALLAVCRPGNVWAGSACLWLYLWRQRRRLSHHGFAWRTPRAYGTAPCPS